MRGGGGKEEVGVNVLFSDHIILDLMQKGEWDQLSQKYFGDTGHSFEKRGNEEIEAFLSEYLNKSVELLSVQKENNASSGFPIWNFKIKDK